jgi:putative hemolysin
MRGEILELGRASIDREHRTPEVLTLLWRGIAQYATDMQLRYLIGCSSLNSVDPARGLADVSTSSELSRCRGVADGADGWI